MEARIQGTPDINRHLPFGPPGERYLSITRVCDKLSRRKSWVYEKIKSDPTFPFPVRIGGRQSFIESAIDEWVVLQNQDEQFQGQQKREGGR